MKNNIIFFISLSFGGNAGAGSGPNCISDLINKSKISDRFDTIHINQLFDESTRAYLNRVKGEIGKAFSSYRRIIIFGGNHLSVFPVYQLMSMGKKVILTLDAHKDLYDQNEINHATFMRFIDRKNVRQYILGARDEKDVSSYPNLYISNNLSLITKSSYNETIDYLDIDCDVLNPEEFNSVGSPIEGGYSIKDVRKIIMMAKEKKCKIYSFSEFIPYMSEWRKDANTILSFIEEIIQ